MWRLEGHCGSLAAAGSVAQCMYVSRNGRCKTIQSTAPPRTGSLELFLCWPVNGVRACGDVRVAPGLETGDAMSAAPAVVFVPCALILAQGLINETSPVNGGYSRRLAGIR